MTSIGSQADSVILFENGMVMVFDPGGQQIAELQDNRQNQEEAILRRCNEGTEFGLAVYRSSYQCVSLGIWLREYRTRGYWTKVKDHE